MPTVSSRLYSIFPGSPAITTTVTRLVSLGASGVPGTPHILTHPDSAIADFSYMLNPDHVLNYDGGIGPINMPLTSANRTLGGTVVTRFETNEDDVVVIEQWTAEGGKFSMPAPQWRLLFEMIDNAPQLDGNGDPQYVTWQPRSMDGRTWQVELMGLTAGTAGADALIREVLERDPAISTPFADILGSFDVSMANGAAGLMRDPVSLAMKIVAEVV